MRYRAAAMTLDADFIEKVPAVEADAALHSFLNDLADHIAVAVLDHDGKGVQGVITLDDVSQRHFGIKTKAASIVQNVTRLDAADDPSALDAVEALLSGPYRAVPVLDEDGRYAGMVTERSVLVPDVVAEVDGPVEAIMNDPLTVGPDATVGKCRSLMRTEDIGRLPVVDDGGRLVGLVEWGSLLVLERPKNRQRPGDAAGGYVQDDAMAARTVMDPAPLTVGRDTPIAKAVERMREEGRSYAVVVDDLDPVGILTCQDVLELVGARAPREGVFIQVSGAQDLGLDDYDLRHLHARIDEGVGKVARIWGGLQSFYLHVKAYEESGSQRKYSLRARLMTPAGPYFAKGHGYDVLATVDDVMDRMERIVKEDREKTRDRRRQPYEFDEEEG